MEICNGKFKPHDGEADKPGKSQLDLESSRELVRRLKEEDWIAATLDKEDCFCWRPFLKLRRNMTVLPTRWRTSGRSHTKMGGRCNSPSLNNNNNKKKKWRLRQMWPYKQMGYKCFCNQKSSAHTLVASNIKIKQGSFWAGSDERRRNTSLHSTSAPICSHGSKCCFPIPTAIKKQDFSSASAICVEPWAISLLTVCLSHQLFIIDLELYKYINVCPLFTLESIFSICKKMCVKRRCHLISEYSRCNFLPTSS